MNSEHAGDAPFCELVELPKDKQPVLRIIPMPADTNAHGTIFGGWVMAQVDLAGSVPAVTRARGKCVTVSVNSFQFKQPVLVGDLVSFYAEVVKVGRTSITVDVEVYSQRQRYGAEVVKVTEAQLTYVAIDDQRKPRMVPEE
ncbi:MAG: acyl-CoA thioesterase [Betaproteobacteria bacterium]|nr:acyl-CoA thioesterase [Betaproteobacteria bacterium]